VYNTIFHYAGAQQPQAHQPQNAPIGDPVFDHPPATSGRLG
jgi:hypothetical protein